MAQQKQAQLEIFENTSRIKKQARPHGEVSDKTPDFEIPAHLYIKSACILIIIVVSFAIGVERGKVVSQKKVSTRFLAEKHSPAIIKEIKVGDGSLVKTLPENKKLEKKEKTDTIKTSGYSIQVASYKKDSSYINKEISKLRKDGYKTITISSASSNYMGICAGKYINKKEAQKHLKQLQRTYKDCFIRKI
ncbi:SPOR domain-containing protein [Candidatus Omnitrophota bacterium]